MPDDLFAVAISGSPRAPSRSRTLAERALSELEALGCGTQLIDVAVLPSDALVGRARIVVAASPTYRAMYTGVLKCFFDLMPQAHLAGKICVGLQTGIAPQHALSAEYGFRPLFASLEGVPLSVTYALDADFAEGKPSAELVARVQSVMRSVVNAARAG